MFDFLFDKNLKAVRALNKEAARQRVMDADAYAKVMAMCKGHTGMFYQAERQCAYALHVPWLVRQGKLPVMEFPSAIHALPGEQMRGKLGATPAGEDLVGSVYVSDRRVILLRADGLGYAWGSEDILRVVLDRYGEVRLFDTHGGCTVFNLFMPEYRFAFSALVGLMMSEEVSCE